MSIEEHPREANLHVGHTTTTCSSAICPYCGGVNEWEGVPEGNFPACGWCAERFVLRKRSDEYSLGHRPR